MNDKTSNNLQKSSLKHSYRYIYVKLRMKDEGRNYVSALEDKIRKSVKIVFLISSGVL